MQQLKLSIKKLNDTDLEITYHRASDMYTTFWCTINQLKRSYKISIEELSPLICRKIIKDNKFRMECTVDFSSKVTTSWSQDKQFKFQLEDGLIHILHLPTQREIFAPLNTIPNYYKLKPKAFEKMLQKKKIVAVNTRIDTFDFNLENQ